MVAGVLLGLSLLRASAQSPGNYEGARWTFLDASKVMAAAAAITLDRYPDCDEATVEQKMMRVYRADGTGEAQDETFTKVLTEKGKRNNRELSLSFELPYNTVEVVKLEVISPKGETVVVDVAANSKETIDDSQMAMNIYDPNNKVLRVSIPKLEIGDVVHSVTRTTTQRAIITGEFSDLSLLEGPGYLCHLSYEVLAPADKPLKQVFVRDEISGTVTYKTSPGENAAIVHHWEVANVPRMFNEPGMPRYENVLQRLLVSTTPDWRFVSRWYWNLSQPHLEATVPEMKTTVEELIAGAKTDIEKVEAVFYYVSKKIRYMGLTPEKDRPGFEPHDVKLTFEKKYGVCRDKAVLLVSLLRTAGLKAFPVLINVGTKMDSDAPTPWFNHAIVCVELKPREYTLMDPTDENTKEILPAYDRDQSFLVCRPEGEGISISPISPSEDNLLTIKTTGTLSVAGFLEATSDISFAGVNDNAYREAFVKMKPDDQRRFMESDLKRLMPGARLKTLKITPSDMLDISQPLHAVVEFTAEGLTASGSGKSMVGMPWVGKGLGVVNFILGNTGLEKRKYPLQTSVACGLKEEIVLKLGEGFATPVSIPSGPPMEDKAITYARHFDLRNGVLSATRELKLKVVEFTPSEYLKLKDALKVLDYDERKMPVLALADGVVATTPAPPDSSVDPVVESNARILESHKNIDVKDAHTSTLRVHYSKLILNYAGKIREAEVKVDFNPSCQEARILHATVTSKTGQRQEIAKDEINVMDEGWNASAKRYTGGKILVANLPGVDIGSTIDVEYEIATKGGLFVAGFESFQLPDQLEKKTVIMTSPAGIQIQKLITGPSGMVQEEVKNAEGRQVITWRIEKAKALPAESQLPPAWAYLAGVGYFAGDAEAYYKDLYAAMVARGAKRVKTEETVRQLTNGKARLEAVRGIRDFIAKSIRAAGPSFTELPLSELSDADTTLSDGYGHAADRAILCYAMLAAAGFEPEFVLASGLPPIAGITNVTATFPLPEAFATPLVRVSVDGAFYYLNDTDQYARLGSTAHDGRSAVVLSTRAAEVIHAAPDCGDKVDTVYSLSLADNGRTRIGISHRYFGGDYNGRNRYFSELPPEERRRYFQKVVSGVAQGARPLSDLTTQFEGYPGIEEFTVEVDNYCVADGRYFYFELPFTPSLFPPGPEHRSLPWFVWQASRATVRTEIEMPPGFKKVVIAPPSEELDAPCGSGMARATSRDEGPKFVLTHEFLTSPAIVEPKDYPGLLQVESALGRKSSRTFLLEASDAASVKAAP